MTREFKNIKERLTRWTKDNQSILIIILTFILFKLPLLNFPLYWDEPAYNDIRLWRGNIDFLLPWNLKSYGLNNHPNGLQIILGIFYQVFGNGLWVTHFTSLTLSSLTLFYSYKLQLSIFNKKSALITVCLFAISPLFFSQATQLLPDIPTLCFGLGTAYFFFQRKWKSFILSSMFLGLIAESGLAFSVSLFLVSLGEYSLKRIKLKSLVLSLLPSFFLVYYFLKQRFISGRFIQHPAILGRETHGFSWLNLNEENLRVLKAMNNFLVYNFSALTLIILAAVLILIIRKYFINNLRSMFYPLFAILFYGFFYVYGDYHPRNILPVYYFIAVLLSLGACLVFEKNRALSVVFLVVISFLIGKQNFKPFDTGDSTYVSYIDEVNLSQKTLAYFEKHKLPEPVYATFPIAYFFEDIGSGYFSKPYKVIPYYSDNQWRYSEREAANTVVITSIEENHRWREVSDWLVKDKWILVKYFKNRYVESWIYVRREFIHKFQESNPL